MTKSATLAPHTRPMRLVASNSLCGLPDKQLLAVFNSVARALDKPDGCGDRAQRCRVHWDSYQGLYGGSEGIEPARLVRQFPFLPGQGVHTNVRPSKHDGGVVKRQAAEQRRPSRSCFGGRKAGGPLYPKNQLRCVVPRRLHRCTSDSLPRTAIPTRRAHWQPSWWARSRAHMRIKFIPGDKHEP